MTIVTDKNGKRKTVSKTFKIGGSDKMRSTALIIPKPFAEKMGLFSKPAYVIFVETDDGLLIKKVEI